MHRGARDRDGEEETVSRLILVALAEACSNGYSDDDGVLRASEREG